MVRAFLETNTASVILCGIYNYLDISFLFCVILTFKYTHLHLFLLISYRLFTARASYAFVPV